MRDTRDSELLSARAQRSWAEASVAAAQVRAQGLGGADALGAPQLASGVGSRAHTLPYRPGDGRDGALDTRDQRYIHWFTLQRKRVTDRVVFPIARALAKDQGTTIYRVVVRRDGEVSGPVSLVRSSGYRDFDSAARTAIESTPFAPLPRALAPELDEVAILLPVQFVNPMVQ